MLVLSRRPRQSILIGDNIEITITKIDRGQVWLAIKAPQDVHIMRTEIIGKASKCASEHTSPPVAGASDSAGPDAP